MDCLKECFGERKTTLEKLIDWINEPSKPIWWKHAVRLLLNKRFLGQNDLEQLFLIAKKETGFKSEIDLDEFRMPVSAVGYEREITSVNLVDVNNVNNVSALASNQKLQFEEEGLTIVYGDNGAGKSSYTKILKNSCLTRGEKPRIKGNLHTQNNELPSASITYKYGDELKCVNWQYGLTECDDLKAVRVFDTSSSQHYLTQDGKLECKPEFVSILEELQRACTYVDSEILKYHQGFKTPHALPPLSGDGEEVKFINSLCAESTKDQLISFLITEDEKKELVGLNVEIPKLKGMTVLEQRKQLQHKIQLLKPLQEFWKTRSQYLSIKELEDSFKIRETYVDLKKALEEEVKSTFKDLPISGVGSNTWRTMWEAARNFVSSIDSPSISFPVKENEHCPLCLQKVNNSDLLAKFEKHILEELQTKFDNVLKALNKQIQTKSLISLDHVHLSENQKIFFEYLEAKSKEYALEFKGIYDFELELFRSRQKTLSLPIDTPLDEFEVDNTLFRIEDEIESLINSLTESLSKLSTPQDYEKLIKEKEARVVELNNKQFIHDNRENIKDRILYFRREVFVNKIRQACQIAPITRINTKLFEDSKEQLAAYFEEELEKLRFKSLKVTTKTKGRKGELLLGLKFTNSDESLNEVASEGESKCISLALSIAELRVDSRNSSIVFDDPVNSLDHNWRQIVAQRLVDESLTRQVIVFTHDITFLLMLDESAKSSGASFDIKALTKSGFQKTGIVQESPPWSTMSTGKRIKWLRDKSRDIKKLREGDEELYKDRVRWFYGKKREAWERLVEECLLNKVTERFSRSIQTNRLKKLVDDINQSDFDTIQQAMSKCSTYFTGHDDASALGSIIIEPEEITADLDAFDAYYKGFSKRR